MSGHNYHLEHIGLSGPEHIDQRPLQRRCKTLPDTLLSLCPRVSQALWGTKRFRDLLVFPQKSHLQ